ncbi:efflux RND transporter periplasmic adaptor subunit [Pseudaquabacterium pictum]|uniref:efflux RND transporter periplasmic adaptor subunit n=1 Tax=Pseudaquabacterium pictum TaxID=2315236 RepID=UPI0010F7EDA0|nr:efflux RND transporter periplasmic adaptor subunit [Rubrivivax pictus]
MKKVHTTLVVVALAGAVAAAWWLQNRPGGGLPGMAATAAAPAARGASGAGGPPGAGGPGQGGPVPVEAGKVTVARLEDDAQAVGTLRSNQSVVVRPEVSGRVIKLGFADGQRVRRGQLLVQLDDTLQQAQLQQAEAQASIARTNLQRSRELVAQNFVSQSAVDQNAAALEVAMAQVALAKAQAARLQIYAPFDGVTGIKLVNVGDYLKDGADIVNLEDVSSVWVDFRLPERFLSRTRPGQPVEITLDALPGRKLQAVVGALDSQLDANGRSVLVRAKLANGDGVLRSGMFARARVVFSVREAALVVPEEALVPQGDKQFLVQLVPGEKGLVSKRLEARIGQRAAGKVEVLSGLAEGDTVVLAGQARLMRADGTPVRVVDLNRPGGRAGRPGGGASAPAGAGSAPGGAGGPPAARAASAA